MSLWPTSRLRDELRTKRDALGEDHPLYYEYQYAIERSLIVDVGVVVALVFALGLLASIAMR